MSDDTSGGNADWGSKRAWAEREEHDMQRSQHLQHIIDCAVESAVALAGIDALPAEDRVALVHHTAKLLRRRIDELNDAFPSQPKKAKEPKKAKAEKATVK